MLQGPPLLVESSCSGILGLEYSRDGCLPGKNAIGYALLCSHVVRSGPRPWLDRNMEGLRKPRKSFFEEDLLGF